jgi:glycosyltransferase involved in cell wall biosynthesis
MSTSPALPRLAVVIPCYNAADWIAKTIASVLEQDYPDLVLIVCDDGSTDGSAEVVRGFGDRVILQSGPNRGACHARNQGTRIAREQGASYVLYLDADDYLEGPMLKGAGRVAADTGADIVVSNMHLLHYDGRREERFHYTGRIAPETLFEGWMRGRYVNPSAILWRLAFVEQIGGWDETLARAQDADITLRATFAAPLIQKNDEGAAIHARVNTNSVSRLKSHKAIEARMRVHRDILARMPGTPMEPLMGLMFRRYYWLVEDAFVLKHNDLGRAGLQELRKRGYRANPGSTFHRLATRLLGLETKVRLFGK